MFDALDHLITRENEGAPLRAGEEGLHADVLVALAQEGLARERGGLWRPTLLGIQRGEGPRAQEVREALEGLLWVLQGVYRQARTRRFSVSELARRVELPEALLSLQLERLAEWPLFLAPARDEQGRLVELALSDVIQFVSLIDEPAEARSTEIARPSLHALELDGLRPFVRFRLALSPYTEVADDPGRGKSALLDGLALLRALAQGPIAPSQLQEPGEDGRPRWLYTRGVPEAIRIGLSLSLPGVGAVRYEVELHGEGPPSIFRERLREPGEGGSAFLAHTKGRGILRSPGHGVRALPFLTQPNETVLSRADDVDCPPLRALRAYLLGISLPGAPPEDVQGATLLGLDLSPEALPELRERLRQLASQTQLVVVTNTKG